jgi:hypothetical protein
MQQVRLDLPRQLVRRAVIAGSFAGLLPAQISGVVLALSSSSPPDLDSQNER